ncbi:conserved hypothetical protein [Ricinus communis]|uniref:Uncharacterized protein n=1 Tax=Ricinus communis TaxID=3988 RepID=B9RY17_RICCO|nr:conserved hypothetical protein [Ricinus communis]
MCLDFNKVFAENVGVKNGTKNKCELQERATNGMQMQKKSGSGYKTNLRFKG